MVNTLAVRSAWSHLHANIARVKHVLVAYDGSPPARRALTHAAELVRPGDTLSVVNVMPEPGVSARIEPPSDERNRQRLLLQEAEGFLSQRGVEARTIAPVGHPATQILAAADKLKADVIVVGRHGGRVRHLLGPVSSRLVHSAKCDVLVVHATGDPEEALPEAG